MADVLKGRSVWDKSHERKQGRASQSPQESPPGNQTDAPLFPEKVLKGFIRIAGSFWTYRLRRGVSLGVIAGGITCSAQTLKS